MGVHMDDSGGGPREDATVPADQLPLTAATERSWRLLIELHGEIPLGSFNWPWALGLALTEIDRLRVEVDQVRSERDAYQTERDWYEQQLRERTEQLRTATAPTEAPNEGS